MTKESQNKVSYVWIYKPYTIPTYRSSLKKIYVHETLKLQT